MKEAIEASIFDLPEAATDVKFETWLTDALNASLVPQLK